MNIIAIIPARYGSARFEGKPLADIDGHPMIAWVYKRVRKSTLISRVVIATDDQRIADAAQKYGMDCIMTSSTHGTSTERANEVSEYYDADLYIVINGDEPLIDHEYLEQVIPSEMPNPNAPYVANLMSIMANPAEVIDPSNIKVVFDKYNKALFMSRNAIPFPKSSLDYEYYKHVGVLIYNKLALKIFSSTERGKNEKVEDINELRFIENGIPLNMIPVGESKSLSVDTPKDLIKVRSIVSETGLTFYNL